MYRDKSDDYNATDLPTWARWAGRVLMPAKIYIRYNFIDSIIISGVVGAADGAVAVRPFLDSRQAHVRAVKAIIHRVRMGHARLSVAA